MSGGSVSAMAERPRPEPSTAVTLAALLEWRARVMPDALAVQYLDDGEREGERRTFGMLDQAARRLAGLLVSRGLVGRTALLLIPQGPVFLEAFFACAYAGVIAVPAYPPRRNARSARIESIALAASPAAVLTTAATGIELAARLDPVSAVRGVPFIAVDELAGEAPALDPPDDLDAVVFLQYTSGSTAAPRGVAVTHRNLASNLAVICDSLDGHSATATVSWLPLFHDFGLIGNALGSLYAGNPLYLMAPTAFLQRPLRWLEAIARYGVSHAGAPNFAYDLLVDRTTPADRAAIDLSAWRVAYSGAEPIRAATLDRFAAAFAPSGFDPLAWAPCYGLAESTLVVSAGRGARIRSLDRRALAEGHALESVDGSGARLVGAGRIHPSYAVRIVDTGRGTSCPDGRVGEIWVSGSSVAAGYWGQPDQSATAFAARTADGEGPFLRTGDLGFLQGDELFVTGRAKDVLIVRGQNVYPQDVEALTASLAPSAYVVGGVAAFALSDEGDRVGISVEVRRGVSLDTDGAARGSAIASTIIDELELAIDEIVFVPQGALPRTSSGKLQRHLCRAAFETAAWRVLGRWTRTGVPGATEPAELVPVSAATLAAADAATRAVMIEAFLRQLVAEILETTPAAIDPLRTPSELGLDSMRVVEIKYRLDEATGVETDPMLLVEPRSLRALADAVAQLPAPPGAGT